MIELNALGKKPTSSQLSLDFNNVADDPNNTWKSNPIEDNINDQIKATR